MTSLYNPHYTPLKEEIFQGNMDALLPFFPILWELEHVQSHRRHRSHRILAGCSGIKFLFPITMGSI